MGGLTVAYVVLAFREDSAAAWELYAVWSLAGLFLLEFGARIYDSSDRAGYLRSHWLDLVTAIPVPGIPGLRAIRLLRLLRLLKVGVSVRRALFGRGWDESGLIWPTLIIFWIGSASALWLVEHDAPSSTITTFPDAMTAAFLTAATLGFGRHDLPVTLDGQIIAAMIVFFALGLWGYASSNLTRMWLRSKQRDATNELKAVRDELHTVREQLERLTEILLESPAVAAASVAREDRAGVVEQPEYSRV